ncbi:expressed conserved protein [Echinococcus multilocularis]|uniref:Expressed conserved protein n=1 Tax=Echinococcus multilocularis TaxID=6211 RepID=A0A068Y8B9_ECHMU|nr:expressed conserved protein [Echinococcus multilocularis]
MAVHRGDIGVIKKALTDYELKAQEMNVGVNYMALDDERRRQEHLLRELREIEEKIASLSLSSTELPHLASIVGTELSHNTKCLQYLTGISELERSIGEVATHFAERSVKLSDPNSLHKSVVTYKTLTDNVKSCWTYVDQLATLAQIHLKTSAEYHQFYHEANEIEAKLEKQLVIAQKAHHSATMRRSHKETTKVANEIREQLNIMQSLWQRSKKLVKRSETIVPIRMRLGGVAKGVAIGDPNNRAVMVQAMVSLTGPDYKIQKGEHLQLIDNRQDSHLWRVQTSSGIVEVPSICFWLTDTDAKATERAISIKQLCKKTWLEIINLISLRLYEVYVDLLQQFNSQEVVCSHEGALNMLLADLQRQLISTVGQDGRLQSEVDTFRKGVIITKRLERLQSGDINLREPDIVQIRSPLLRLQDHLVAAEQMQQEMKLLNDHIADYLSEVDNERWQISRTLDHLNRLTKKSEQQLNEMMRKIEQMKSGQEMRVSQQTSDRLKVQPLIISEQEQLHKRSRSQPRMTVVNAISSSTTSSDSEPTSDPRTRSGKRRAKSQVRQLDAMVQIGSESKTAETQHQEGRIEVGRRHSQRHKSVQLAPMKPVQLEAQTQIGRSVIDFEVQVDTSSLESYNMVIKGDTSMQRSRSLTPSSEDDEGHEYITEATAALSLQALKDKGRRRITTAAQSGPLSKKKSSSLTNMVHCYTQLGSIITDRAVSPLQAFDSVQSCPNCRPKTLLNSQIQVGQIYSGSEKYPYYPVYEVKSESARQQHLISKKVQSGYPCLTDRANLYCQCDVLGPLTSHVVTEVTSDLYQKEVPPERRKMHSDAQIGVLYANARQQAGNSDNDMMSTSTQVGIVHEDPYQESHISHERRSGLAQTRPRSTQELCSFSGMIETLPLKPDNYVTAVSMRPQAATSSTQIGVLLSESALQTGKYDGVGVSSKRSQIGHSMLSGRSDSYTQVGQLYQQAGVQKGHVEINVEPGMVPVIQAPSSVERSVPPPKNNLNGMSIQVTPKTHDDTRQIANVLSHNEVQTRDLPNFNVRQQNLQVYDIHRHKPRRSSSVPSVQFSTETQIGPMVMHESLSPINVDTCVNIVRPTEMLNVKATPRVMKNKRIQSAGIPSARNVGMQIGHLLQESGTQSMVGVDNFEETPIAPTLLSVQQKAISMPNVGIAETQTQPLLHGKKMQVSISMYSPTAEKKHNKKLQVSIVTSREMYDVQVETVPFLQKEQFDVSCDTKIQPDKIPKKIQVSLLGSGPEILMVSNQDPVHASMPPRSPVETVLPVQPQLTAPVQSAPPSRFTDIACEAVIDAVYFDAKCQCDDLKPMTQGKKLQVELGGQMIKPKKVDIACDSNDLVKTVGKKLQVDLNAPSQTTLKEMKDEICAALDERKMFDATQQTVTTEEQLPIFAQATAQPVYSAPPVAQTVNTCDTACEALRTELACDGFTQSEKIQGVGKKLQVAITFAESEKPVYEIATMQAYSEDAFVSLAESSRVRSVYAASPPRLTVDMEDRGCEAMPKSEFFDASVQSAEFVQPKPMVLGKKLQVSLPNLTTSSIQMEQPSASKPLGYPKAIQAEEFYTQLAPHLIPLQEAPKVYSAPQIPHPEASTEDRACDAIASSSTFDAAIQATGAPKPEVFGKKLQVNLMPLVVMSSQSTIEFQPPSQPIYLENATRVFSAPPPPAQPKVQTDDKACDAITTTPAFDAGVQIAEQEKPRAFVVGKKLQVKPPSLSLVTAQTIFEQPPPQVQMEEKSCDAIKPIKVFDAGVQAAELQQPKAVVVGKKLQVTLPPALVIISSQGTGVVAAPERPHVALEVSGVQTVQELTIEPPTQAVHVQETSRVFAAPSPQPHVQTDEKSCDAIEFTSLFDAGVQAAELQQPKAVVVGKKLQVTLPPALVIISSQGTGVVAAPERPHVALEVSGVQTVQELTIEPPTQAVHVQETSRVFAAPSPQPHVQTDEKSCDAIEFTSLFDAGVQVADILKQKPRIVGKNLQVSLSSFTPVKSVVVDKGIQMSPLALKTSIIQWCLKETTPPSQIIRVEETNKVFAVPPPSSQVAKVPMTDKECETVMNLSMFDADVQIGIISPPTPLKIGKKLQVCPAPYSILSVQTREETPSVIVKPVALGKKLQVSPPPLELSSVQSTLQVESVPQPPIVKTEEARIVFAAPPSPLTVTVVDAESDALELGQLFDASTQSSPVTFADTMEPPEKLLTCGKKLQADIRADLVESKVQTAAIVKLEVVRIQTETEPTRRSITNNMSTQANNVQQPETPATYGKKMQVDLHPPMDEKSAQIELPYSLKITSVQTEMAAPTPVMIPQPAKVSQSLYSAPPRPNTEDRGIDAKYLPLMSITVTQADAPSPTISYVQSTFHQPELTVSKVQMCDFDCNPLSTLTSNMTTQSEEVIKFGKKMQVTPPAMEIGISQTTWQEVDVPPIIGVKEAPMIRSAPPLPTQVSMKDAAADPLSSKQCTNAFTQVEPVPTYGKKMQVVPPALCSCTCQAVPTETSAPSPVIKSAKEAVSVFIAPPVKALTTEDKACEPMFKTPVNDVSLQYDTITHKPPSRSVRIQKGVGAFEGKRAICVQYNAPEPRRSPLSPLLSRNTSGIEWGVQIQPTTLVGTTQTPPTETSMVFTTSKPDVYSRTTQVDLDQYKPVKHADLFSTAPIPARQPQNLFSFVRETKARVSSRRIRSGSQGLIPYKTQVFSPSSSLSLSVPAMLNVQTEAPSPATIADCYGYTNHIAASQVPRRYISRFRSPTVRGSYDRRNKSMENIYFRGSRTMPRQFISDSDLTMANRRILQQMELEERCEECITHCVRLIGYEKAAQMLMDARICAEFGQHGNLEGDSRRRHLQNARTQYTSTTTIACPYCCQASVREGEGRTWWPSGAGEEEFYSGEDGYEWDSMQSSYGSAKHGSYRWVSRTPIIRVMQTEPTSDAVDMLMKNRALSAYCSDYELQQSGINANFEENAAFTFVAWKTDQQGEDKLELDTVGNLLRLTLVGARVPGTGEVISAADAFYRSILRVIYMDDERGVIMPLTTAINANAVIVEKRFSTGVGISFHHPSRKYPVECTAVWQTPNMRRRTYRVNYIRLSDKERIPVSKALEQGIIDKYSGEIVGVRTLPKAEMGDPLLQMRESSVGTGDTMARKQHPERFNVREAILNDIVSVDLIQPEIILLPSSEADTATHSRRREGSVSPSTESNSDLEV